MIDFLIVAMIGTSLFILVIVYDDDLYFYPVVAFLFNCSEPEAITKSLQSIRTGTTLTGDLQSRCVLLGAYANRLTPVEVDWSLSTSSGQQMTRSDLSPEQYYKDFVAVWVKEFNVKVVGGCCGISPRHIAYLRDNLPVKPR